MALGNFDGLHLGHMRLIAALTRRASAIGAPSLIYTFRDHPKNVLGGDIQIKLLTGGSAKSELLSETGVDGVYFENFDKAFADMPPGEFVRRILVEKFGVCLVAVGSGFRFGRGGSGGIAELREYGLKYGFGVEEAAAACAEGIRGPSGEPAVISSSLIRDLLASGRVEKAAALMGRLFALKAETNGSDNAIGSNGSNGANGSNGSNGANGSGKSNGSYGFGGVAGAYNGAAVPCAPVYVSYGREMAAPGPGVYIVAAAACGLYCQGLCASAHRRYYRGLCASAHWRYFRGLCAVGCDNDMALCLPGYNGGLHGTEIDIFFYKAIRDTVNGGGAFLDAYNICKSLEGGNWLSNM